MSAIDILIEEHETINEILGKIESTSPMEISMRKNLIKDLLFVIQHHERKEETIFYPPLMQHYETGPMVFDFIKTERHIVEA